LFPGVGPLILGFVHHAVLLTFLISASGCDLQGREDSVSPDVDRHAHRADALHAVRVALASTNPLPAPVAWPPVRFRKAFYAWPIWWPLPSWLPAFSWYEGLATGLAGALMGTFCCGRSASSSASGRARRGSASATPDLMMMVGSFLGWQMVLVAFFRQRRPRSVLRHLPGFGAQGQFAAVWPFTRRRLDDHLPVLGLDWTEVANPVLLGHNDADPRGGVGGVLPRHEFAAAGAECD